MYYLIIINLLLIISLLKPTLVQLKVVSESRGKIQQFPFMVIVFGEKSYGSGVLVTRQHVLTAAYYLRSESRAKTFKCVAGDSQPRVKRGEKTPRSRQEWPVVKAALHPLALRSHKKNMTSRRSDLAVLTVARNFTLTRSVMVAPLAKYLMKSDSNCVGVGFRRIYSVKSKPRNNYYLRYGKFKMSRWFCPSRYASLNVYCVRNEDEVPFINDPGSPLLDRVQKPTVYGIFSRRYGDSNYYIKIASNRYWIQKQLSRYIHYIFPEPSIIYPTTDTSTTYSYTLEPLESATSVTGGFLHGKDKLPPPKQIEKIKYCSRGKGTRLTYAQPWWILIVLHNFVGLRFFKMHLLVV